MCKGEDTRLESLHGVDIETGINFVWLQEN